MSRKTLKWLWRAGVLGVYILASAGDSINDLFFHTDRFLAGFAGVFLMMYMPDMISRKLNKRKTFFIMGGVCFLLLTSAVLSTVMDIRYGTEEIFMPIYGEYMVTSGKRDRMLISTRSWRIGIRYRNRRRERNRPEYIYLMEEGTGTEENIQVLLRRRYGPEVEMKNHIVALGEKTLGFYDLYKNNRYDRVVFTYFDSRPFPDE